jgi:hypothetical protein
MNRFKKTKRILFISLLKDFNAFMDINKEHIALSPFRYTSHFITCCRTIGTYDRKQGYQQTHSTISLSQYQYQMSTSQLSAVQKNGVQQQWWRWQYTKYRPTGEVNHEGYPVNCTTIFDDIQ